MTKTYSLADAANDAVDFAMKDHVRFGTGFSIDNCGCPGQGELALLVARSSTGKSTLMLNVVANTPEVPTVVFNMEMTPRRQAEWLVAMSYDLETPAKDIEDVLHYGPEDSRYGEVRQAFENVSDNYPNLHLLMPSRPSVTDLMMAVDDIADETGVKPQRVFVDHLTLMDCGNDYQRLLRTTADLHAWALKDDLCLMVLQQTGRAGGENAKNDGHIPVTLSSGVMGGEQDADFVFGLYQPSKHPKYRKPRSEYEDSRQYWNMHDEYEELRGMSVLQLVKNRPFGEVNEVGIELRYDWHTRRLAESADDYS